jgi:two-component system OmpR family sensor kinase
VRTSGGRRDEVADLARDFDTMADRVEELIRSREQLVNDVSHELRSPLTRLRLAIALTRQRPESGVADHQAYFDLSELLRKLIADASFERDSVQVKFAAAEINASLDQARVRGIPNARSAIMLRWTSLVPP